MAKALIDDQTLKRSLTINNYILTYKTIRTFTEEKEMAINQMSKTNIALDNWL